MLSRESEENRPVSRVQEQGARSRERILDAAETLMADRGYAGTSISAICKESGLPASSVYWHFENKAGLLHAVIERGTGRMLAEIEASYDVPGTPRERLHRLLSGAAAAFEAQPREFRRLELLLTLERGSADSAWRETIDHFHTKLRGLIEEALFEIYRPIDEKRARTVAREGARLAELMGSGAIYQGVRAPEEFKPSAMIEYCELALMAVAERRLGSPQAKGSGAP